ncbi:hypothetical protein D0Z08_19880 [Nocardioides immobilis]|uniref:Uncharacterized protein n=1 Tax=Nocardioides immobilis TaxID=2049295 RepID=A0A417XXZ8_9ACTN|nr:hypothetical protein [Nocardioides immobilis]RHW25225.1 hypothetical protein D0Z08_19880 [Nocardioides immobilis]
MPQPWDWEGEHRTRDEFMADALNRESDGARLVVENVVGWQDVADGPDSWVVDDFIYTDYRTDEYVWHYDPDELDDPSPYMTGFVIVERRHAEMD